MNQDPYLLYPLNEFYEQAGLSLPKVERIEGNAVPEPYRALLVHNRDMTPTLIEAYRRNLQLRILRQECRDDVYSRQIALEVEDQAVVFGAIKIYLDHFPPRARGLVLEGKRPLGAILHSEAIEHRSRPEAYFQVASDAVINEALGLPAQSILYGRRNVLWNTSQHPLAKVIEILPPWRKP
jgi:chorismate-pyruvate lyase